ncbi:MAG: hypothetical protein IT521_06190 [Burkholderiales bacterium]|nr:hypothetical protein [Burkholderiales bacterium]
MNQDTSLTYELSRAATTVMDRVIEYLPSIIGAVLLLFAGWMLAILLRAVTARALALLDGVMRRILGVQVAERARVAQSAGVLGGIVYWGVLLFFVAAASQTLGLDTFTQWLAKLLDHLPTVIAGLLIVAAGYVLARVVADLILRATPQLAESQRLVVARATQASILVAAILVGADQIGIRVTFLAIFVGIGAGAIAGGVVIAISLGARVHVANLIGIREVGRTHELGQRIRVAGYEGRILELTGQAVVLETDDGRVSLPGRIFSEEPVVRIATSGRDG